jgi:hypothetical protein
MSLNGSAFGDGMNCIRRKSCSVLAASVIRILPSCAGNFKVLQIVVLSPLSCLTEKVTFLGKQRYKGRK